MSDKTCVWGTVTREALAQYGEDIMIKFLENVQVVADAGVLREDANWLDVYAIMELTVENSIRNDKQHKVITKMLRPYVN
jgi:hypothetical protein